MDTSVTKYVFSSLQVPCPPLLLFHIPLLTSLSTTQQENKTKQSRQALDLVGRSPRKDRVSNRPALFAQDGPGMRIESLTFREPPQPYTQQNCWEPFLARLALNTEQDLGFLPCQCRK